MGARARGYISIIQGARLSALAAMDSESGISSRWVDWANPKLANRGLETCVVILASHLQLPRQVPKAICGQLQSKHPLYQFLFSSSPCPLILWLQAARIPTSI
jgi:hypothetical protein